MPNQLTCISDLNPEIVHSIMRTAFTFKEGSSLEAEQPLKGKVIAMIFEKPSLRTKVAFEVAASSLGATPVFLTSAQILASGQQEQGRESVTDIARNLERYADLILARVYSHAVIREIAEAIQKPVINALCDSHHPTQALADLMAIIWHKKELKGLKVAYVGDGNNVATSLAQICALMGIDFSIGAPENYEISKEEWAIAESFALSSSALLGSSNDPQEAVLGADVVYTDTFVSMGQEEERAERGKIFKPYQVNADLMKLAKSDAIFMHCLPAHREEEVSTEIFDSEQSVVFDQAECRLHIAKSLYWHFLT